jgi:hypothetical protein
LGGGASGFGGGASGFGGDGASGFGINILFFFLILNI